MKFIIFILKICSHLLNEVRIKCNKLNVYCLNVCWYRVDVCMCVCLLCVCVCNCMHACMLVCMHICCIDMCCTLYETLQFMNLVHTYIVELLP